MEIRQFCVVPDGFLSCPGIGVVFTISDITLTAGQAVIFRTQKHLSPSIPCIPGTDGMDGDGEIGHWKKDYSVSLWAVLFFEMGLSSD